jgi:hypothetical protein
MTASISVLPSRAEAAKVDVVHHSNVGFGSPKRDVDDVTILSGDFVM